MLSNSLRLVFAIIATCFAFTTVYADTTPTTAGAAIPDVLQPLAPEKKQTEVNQIITRLLDDNHYRQMPINQQLSSTVFDRYIKSLDPDKYFFLQSDIAEFEKHRYDFDRWLTLGDLHAAFDIYNRFQKRLSERVDFALAALKKPFDFTNDILFETNREHAKWATSKDELDELWQQRITNDALNLKLSEVKIKNKDKTKAKDGKAAKKPTENKIELLTKRYQDIKRRAAQTNGEDVFQIYMNAFTEAFDPHTEYMSPRTSQNFMMHMSLSLQGIGAVLKGENEYTQIVELVPGGPADLSKELKPDDKIVAVSQGDNKEFVDVVGWRLDDVVDKIRGPKETVVRLKVIPATAIDPSDVKIVRLVRNKIDLKEQAAKSEVIKVTRDGRTSNIGVIKIPTFYSDFEGAQKGDENYRSTTRDVHKLLDDLKKQSIEGLVIDLRGDGGGSLTEATNLTGLFIKEGPVVQVRYKNGDVQLEADTDPAIVYSGPLAVMVDRYSASASEIFAAAIQDYGRGVIVGETTFGKGTVQSLVDLNRYIHDSDERQRQLKLTTAKFYRVSGASTQHRGVIPDISYPSALAADEAGESGFDSALPWDQIDATRYSPYSDFKPYIAELKSKHDGRMASNPMLKLLQEEIADLIAAKAKSAVSLQETQRVKQRDEFAKRERERLNATLKLQGLKPLKDGDELAKDYLEPDVLKDETANIVLDLKQLTTPVVAKTQ